MALEDERRVVAMDAARSVEAGSTGSDSCQQDAEVSGRSGPGLARVIVGTLGY